MLSGAFATRPLQPAAWRPISPTSHAMLKKITVDHVRIGMHIHKLEGAWLSHPFWKTRFVLDDPADLQRLRDSGVPAVWIDPALGVDVAVPDAEVVPPP